ncbi:MAG: universal stress protein [Proteobacteria bacterium]|nr:universal stress protein [Desulfobacteraceae bacterium]MBU4012071.1 universal stress protein [Pseudomonadota bacterium]MBU4067272.1 universal stress protein [Pseudomonadota bacterium]MBU4127279.1 universal stress protein [Pseudomonadota bacterium]MBU4208642.1 universal stress protein [Pseudomonadota bacterium]
MGNLTKSIVVPVDGSKNSLRSLEYINLIYGPNHNLEVTLIYILPSLPPILTDKSIDKKTRTRLKSVEKKNEDMAEKILAEAQNILLNKGFKEEKIKTRCQKRGITVAQDICNWALIKQVDTILLTKRGRTEIKSFFMGKVSTRLVEYRRNNPVWILEGGIDSKNVLVCVDNSENALRAVDHVGFMLSGTDCHITIFHTMRHLSRFVPMQVLEEAEDLEKLWRNKAGKEIAPYIKKAMETLLKAGLSEEQITTKVTEGSRSAADDILKEAQDNNYGTIVLGRRGLSAVKEFFMGGVTTSVLNRAVSLAIWIVQ